MGLLALSASAALAGTGPTTTPGNPTIVDGNSGTGYVVTGTASLAGLNSNVLGPTQSLGNSSSQTVYTDFATSGGTGSGGGGGLGGVFFIDNGATLNLTNVTFNNNTTTGGNGGGPPVQSVSAQAFAIAAAGVNAAPIEQVYPAGAGGSISGSGSNTQFQLSSITLAQSTELVGVNSGVALPNQPYLSSVSSLTSNDNGSETISLSKPITLTPGNGIDVVTANSSTDFTLTDNTAIAVIPGQPIVGSGIPDGVVVGKVTYDNSGNIKSFTAVDAQGSLYSFSNNQNFVVVTEPGYNFARFAFDLQNPIVTTLVTTAPLAGFATGMTVTGTGVPFGTKVTGVTSSIDPTTGNAVFHVTFSNPVNLLLATNLAAAFVPIVSNTGQAVISLPSVSGLAVGQTLTGTGIPAGTTITNIDSNTNQITLSTTLGPGAVNQITNHALFVSVDSVTGSTPNSVTLTSVAGYKVGDVITGDPSIPANAIITNINSNTNTITYQVNPTSLGTGGSMNNLASSGNPAINGLNGTTGSNFGLFDAGEGLPGSNGTSGANGNGGAGGNGGNGGVGSNGLNYNPNLIVAVTVDTLNAYSTTVNFIANIRQDFVAGTPNPTYPLLGPEYIPPGDALKASADIASIASAYTVLIYNIIQLAEWQVSEEAGLQGLGGAGGYGGAGGKGDTFFGGGAGGLGGNGGQAGCACGIGGTPGDGGFGGAGGFGAGGGSGGSVGVPGANGDYNSNGSPGSAGFGGGVGSVAGANGQGGSGYGGAIFVRAGGTLNISGNAIFQNNAAFAGASSNGGSAGQAVGNDLFMMTGSNVSLTPGAGHTITFWDSIADDSSSSISGTSIAAGQGASITIGGGGTVQFLANNTYSGKTIISGGTLEATDGAGVNASSHVLFNGQGTLGDLSSSNAGVWLLGNATSATTEIRPVGLQPNNISWTDGLSNFGSGGFAALAGGLTLNFGSINGNAGPTLTWNAGGFVTKNYTLVFGSDATDATGTVTLTNAINLNSLDGKIAVYRNSGSTTDGMTTFDATLAGVISGGSLTVGSAGYTGSLLFSAKNSLTALTVNTGLVSNSNGTVTGRLFDPGVGGALTINGGTVMLGGSEKLTTVTVAPSGALGATAAITADSISNRGTMVFGNTLNVNSVTNSGNITLLGATTLYGAFNNQANGTIIQTAGISGAVGSSVNNSGVWDMSANINVTGAVNNDGTLNVIGSVSGSPIVETAATRVINTSGFTGSGSVNLGGTTGHVANTLVINQSDTTIFSGVISGPGALTKEGTGSLHLSGANSFTGPLTINAGVLAIDAGGKLASTLDVTVGTSSTPTAFADFSVGSDITINSVNNYSTVQIIAGLTLATFTNRSDGTATVSASGSLIARGAVSNAGLMTFNTGSIGTLSSTLYNSGTFNAQATLGVSGRFTNDTTGIVTLGSAGSNTFGSLTNNGTFTSSAALTVTGAVVNTGTMTLNDPSFGSLTNSGTINLNDTLNVSGFYAQNAGSLTTGNNANLSTGSFSGLGGSVVLNGTSLFTINQAADGTYSGSVSGTGTVVKIGASTLTLAGGAGSFAPAALTINAGAVKVQNASILGSALPITTGAAGTLSLLANQSIASLLNNGATNLVANLTTSGTVTDNGTLNVVGTLAGSPVVETAAIRTITTAGFGGSGTVNLGGTTGSVANTLVINQSGDSIFTGSFTGGGGLTKTGTGKLNLQGASTFTGPLAINGGTLDTTGGGTFADTINATVGTAGTFVVGTSDRIASLTNNGVTTVNVALMLATFTNNATGTATVSGSGSLTASGAVSNAGSLTFASGSSETLSSTLYNSGTLTSQGALGVSGLFTNDTGATATLGSAGSNTFGSLTNKGTLTDSSAFTVNGAINNSGSISAAGFSGQTLTNTGSITSSNLIDISGGYVQNAGSLTTTGGLSTGSLSGTGGAIHLDNTSAYILNQTVDGSFAGSISGTGGLLKYGNANLTLTGGVDSFSPALLDIFAGQVIVANAGILNHALNVAVNSGAGLTLQANQTIHNLTGAGSLNLGANNLTLANGGSFSGPIIGSGSVLVSSGQFTLNASSSSSSDTLVIDDATLNVISNATATTTSIINGGVLHLGNGLSIGANGSLQGTLNTGTLNVNGGSSLTGNGTANGNVFVGGPSGGTIAPGNSPGVITVNNITFSNFSTAAMQIDGAAGPGAVGGYDRLNINGTITLLPGSTLAISKSSLPNSFSPALGQQIRLFAFAPGAVSGSFGSATATGYATNMIFNIDTGSVIGIGSNTSAQFEAAVATTPNEQALMNALRANTAGGVTQYFGGDLMGALTSAMASSSPTAIATAFDRWSPEAYAGIVDQMKQSVLDNLSDNSSYDRLIPGRTYATGNVTYGNMSGDKVLGFARNTFHDTAANVGFSHQFSRLEVNLGYGHTEGQIHGTYLQGTVVGNQIIAGLSVPVAWDQKLRMIGHVVYGSYASHGLRNTNSGIADFGGAKSQTAAYGLGLAYHQTGNTQIDLTAEAIGMSQNLSGFAETGAASGAANAIDLMDVSKSHHQAWVGRLNAKVGKEVARNASAYLALDYEHEMGGRMTAINGNLRVDSVGWTVTNPGLARDRVMAGVGTTVKLSSKLRLNLDAKGGNNAAYKFGGGLRLSF